MSTGQDLGEVGIVIDPREVVRAVVRRKWWIVASALLVGAGVAAGTMRQPKVYQATSQILIEPVVPKVLGDDAVIDDLSEQSRTERTFYNTQYQIIKSRVVMLDAAYRIKLTEDRGFLSDYNIESTGDDRDKEILKFLNDHVSVSPELQSRLVDLVVEDRDPDRAARIANAVADAYIAYSLERRLTTSRNASKWLDERVEEFEHKLEEAEKRLFKFQEENMLVSVSFEDRQSMTSATFTKLTEKQIDLEARLVELEARKKVLFEPDARTSTSAADQETSVEADLLVARSDIIADMKRNIAELKTQGAKLSTRYGPRHPNMIANQKQIAEAEARLDRELRVVAVALDSEIDSLKDSEKSIQRKMDEEQQHAMGLNSLGLEYNKLTRDFGTTRKMYESLLKRQTEASLSGLLESNFVHLHQAAESEPIPVRPSVPKNGLIGLLLGFILGLSVVVGGVLLDNTVHTQADIEELLRLPFLGVLPHIDSDKKERERERDRNAEPVNGVAQPNRDLYVAQNPKSAVAECARSIRTNLLFMSTDKPLRRLMVTSPGPAEGKSTTAIVLGVAMAQAGNRVLIVDTDLRRPRLHRTFGVSGERGITSLLLDSSVEPSEAIKKTDVVGLDVLPCGPLPPNPAEIMHTERFANLVKRLEERYDRIVFDSPPIHAVTDAVILSQLVDGVVLVVKASQTAKEAIRRAARKLYDVKGVILGVVLNDLDFEEGGYGYYYYYHRYGYVYGSEAEKKQT
ncbi:MAG: polysaccharide biosynthesis tyrosine autokinase [Myxococcota bacterium]